MSSIEGRQFRQLLAGIRDKEILIPRLRAYWFNPKLPFVTIPVRDFEQRLPDGWFHPSEHPTWPERMLYWYLAFPSKMVPEPSDMNKVLAVTQGVFWHFFTQSCAPGDQKVLLVDGKGRPFEKRIDEIEPRQDFLASWVPPTKQQARVGQNSRDMVIRGGRHGWGYPFEKAVRDFSGELVVMETAVSRTRVTPDHFIPVKWSPEIKDAFGVYLMRKGGWWRIGMTKFTSSGKMHGEYQRNLYGPSMRLHSEGGDGLWLLQICENITDAMLAEQYFSACYGITQAVFNSDVLVKISSVQLKDLHNRLAQEGSEERARKLLSDLHLDVRFPLYPAYRVGARGSFKIRACNLIEDWMQVGVSRGIGQKVEWLPARVHREPVVRIPVYSLNVEPFHTYVGDGQVLYNCLEDMGLLRVVNPKGRTSWERVEKYVEDKRLLSRGSMDGVVNSDNIPVLGSDEGFEFKTMSIAKMSGCPRGAPDDQDRLLWWKTKNVEYYAQNQEYLRMSGLPSMRVLILGLQSPFPMIELQVPYSYGEAMKVADKYARVIQGLADRRLPDPCCTPRSQQAILCPARNVCPVGLMA